MSTAQCKKHIVDYCNNNLDHVSGQFIPRLTTDVAFLSTDIKNWSRMAKEKLADGTILRTFNCKPFEDQLRAYVVQDGNSFKVTVVGE